jgi:predicted dehydrogenase
MKACVMGGGSIGRRHLGNLKTLGLAELGLIEPDDQRRRGLARELGVTEFSSLDEAMEWGPDFFVVATPPHLHLEEASQIAHGGFDLFIEKPLCHREDGMEYLCHQVKKKDLVSMVACNMRFHPGPAKVKELIEKKCLGKLLFARIHAGSYLPSWRQGLDYSKNYAANADTGGGCLLDCIHEIDLARWYLGDVQEVFCISGHLSSLKINTEDVAILLCRHCDGTMSEIHLDYVQRTYERGCQIVGEKGSIFWDFNQKQVRWYDAATEWTVFTQSDDWQVNHMYLDEMRYFIECVRERRPTVLPIAEASAVMQIVFAAKQSDTEGRLVQNMREVRV